MDNLARIKTFSRRFQYFLVFLLITIPVFYITIWISYNDLPPEFKKSLIDDVPLLGDAPLSLMTRLFAAAASLLPVSLFFYAVLTLRKLFSFYEKGILFPRYIVKFYRRFGYILIRSAFIDIVYSSLIVVILTFGLGPENRMLTIGPSSNHLFEIAIGWVIIFIPGSCSRESGFRMSII